MPRNKTGHFYFEWYPTIFKADTQHLTLAEDAAYRRLIDYYMETKSNLPADDRSLSRIIGIGLDEFTPLKVNVLNFFKKNPAGFYTHAFCDEIIAIHATRIEKSRKNGKKGGRPKLPENKPNNPRGYEIKTQQEPITEQNRSKIEEDTNAGARNPFTVVYDFGCELYPNLASQTTHPIKTWLDAGMDVELDVLPIIRQKHTKGVQARGWGLFTQDIADHNAKRLKPMPKGNVNENTSRVFPSNNRPTKDERARAAVRRAFLSNFAESGSPEEIGDEVIS